MGSSIDAQKLNANMGWSDGCGATLTDPLSLGPRWLVAGYWLLLVPSRLCHIPAYLTWRERQDRSLPGNVAGQGGQAGSPCRS